MGRRRLRGSVGRAKLAEQKGKACWARRETTPGGERDASHLKCRDANFTRGLGRVNELVVGTYKSAGTACPPANPNPIPNPSVLLPASWR